MIQEGHTTRAILARATGAFKRALPGEGPAVLAGTSVLDSRRGHGGREHADLAGGHFELRGHDHFL